MPELPEVETVRRGLAPVMQNARIGHVHLGRPNLRFPFAPHFAERLSGVTIGLLRRRAKFLLVELSNGQTLLCHLGMSGRFSIVAKGDAPPPDTNPRHDHVIFTLHEGTRIIYNDPRRFGFMDLVPTHGLENSRFLKNLGPEPLGNRFNGAHLGTAFSGRKTPVKTALLDQRTVAGLGNIYVCEALFEARIHPKTLAMRIAPARLDALANAVRRILRTAIEAGGSTLRDYAAADGALGYFQHAFQVYGREGEACLRAGCPGTIRRVVQGGRSSFYCPHCQH